MTEKARRSDRGPTNLEELFDRVEGAARDEDAVSLGSIVDEFGERTFAPLLLLAGVITLAPVVGDVPGVPTLMSLLVLATAGQMLFGQRHLWLPRILLDRSVSREKLEKALSWLRRPAKFVDRLLRPRLTALTHGAGASAIALACVVIAAALPPMELVPFSANVAGVALAGFGLALIAHDGAVALFSTLLTAATLAIVTFNLV